MSHSKTIAEGLYFPEGPRWHHDRLWFSDFYARAIQSVHSNGSVRLEHAVDFQPSGLGWLPDGRLLVVSMHERKIMCLQGSECTVYADLSAFSSHMCNDMIVDNAGRAWVGSTGFDLDAELKVRSVESLINDHPTANLVRVETDGTIVIVAEDLHFPNGIVINEEDNTLIVAETLAARLSSYRIDDKGSHENATLADMQCWASLGMCAPDGICLDSQGNVWVANALANECVLVAPGGEVLARVETSQLCYACALGGDDGKDLYLCTAQSSDPEEASQRAMGKVELHRVEVAGVGW